MDALIFFSTAPNLNEGKKIARIIVENKIAACVNIIPSMHSIYRWKGNIEEDAECLLIIKTTNKRSDKLVELIKKLHPYEVPECVGFKIEKGMQEYLDWIVKEID